MTRLLLITLVQHIPRSTGREEERTPSVQGKAGRPRREGSPESPQGRGHAEPGTPATPCSEAQNSLLLGAWAPNAHSQIAPWRTQGLGISLAPSSPGPGTPQVPGFLPLHGEELNLAQTELWLLPWPLGDHDLQDSLDSQTMLGGRISWPRGLATTIRYLGDQSPVNHVCVIKPSKVSGIRG